MRPLFLGMCLFACAPAVVTTPPPSPRPPVAAPAPEPAIASPPAIEQPIEPAPTGDRLTLARTGCYGPCPVYDVTIYPDGRIVWHGEGHVSRTGYVHTTIPADAAAGLLADAERLDYAHTPGDPEKASCGSDMPGVVVTLHRGEQVHVAVVDASCTPRLCDDRGRNCKDASAELRKQGFSRKAMIAVEAFANRVDEAIGARVFISDPACQGLPRELLASGGVPASEAADDPARARRLSAYAAMEAALQRDPQAVLRISGLARAGLDAELEQHRRALIARGTAAGRIGVERESDAIYREERNAAVVLTVGPRQCFGVAFAGPG